MMRGEIAVSCVIYPCGTGTGYAVARECSCVDVSMKVDTFVGVGIKTRSGVG